MVLMDLTNICVSSSICAAFREASHGWTLSCLLKEIEWKFYKKPIKAIIDLHHLQHSFQIPNLSHFFHLLAKRCQKKRIFLGKGKSEPCDKIGGNVNQSAKMWKINMFLQMSRQMWQMWKIGFYNFVEFLRCLQLQGATRICTNEPPGKSTKCFWVVHLYFPTLRILVIGVWQSMSRKANTQNTIVIRVGG